MPAPKGNKNAVGNRGGGAPPKYQPRFAQLAAVACQAGFTDREMADLLGVSERTINTWKLRHVDFASARLCPDGLRVPTRIHECAFIRASNPSRQ